MAAATSSAHFRNGCEFLAAFGKCSDESPGQTLLALREVRVAAALLTGCDWDTAAAAQSSIPPERSRAGAEPPVRAARLVERLLFRSA
jgi:hypothetical protein